MKKFAFALALLVAPAMTLGSSIALTDGDGDSSEVYANGASVPATIDLAIRLSTDGSGGSIIGATVTLTDGGGGGSVGAYANPLATIGWDLNVLNPAFYLAPLDGSVDYGGSDPGFGFGSTHYGPGGLADGTVMGTLTINLPTLGDNETYVIGYGGDTVQLDGNFVTGAFDNAVPFTITTLPEPASLALLALGGLVAIRRR